MNNGEHIEYYSDGEINYKCNYIDDELHGEFINYFTSGEVSYKCWYIDGKYHGEFISYYENGDITSKHYYIYGNLVIELKWLSYNRNIKFELLGL